MLTAGAALPFYNEPALAQLSKIENVPPDAVMINANENPLGPCVEAAEAVHSVVSKGGRYMYAETDALQNLLAEQEGLEPSYVQVFAGSSAPLHQAVLAFTSPEKSFVTGDPGYEAGERAAKFIGSKVVRVPLTKDYAHDVKAMAVADSNAGLIYICNPNNPTGTLLERSGIESILQAATNTAVVIDEAYAELSGATVIPWIKKYPQLFVVRTFSKAAGLAALRLGAVMACTDSIALLQRAMPPFPINVAALLAADAAIRDRQTMQRYVRDVHRSRGWFEQQLKTLGVKTYPSAANFVLANFGPEGPALFQRLERKGILLRDRTREIGTGFVRITIGTQKEMERLVREIKRYR